MCRKETHVNDEGNGKPATRKTKKTKKRSIFLRLRRRGKQNNSRKNSLRIVLLPLQDKHTLLQPHAGMEEGGNQAVAEFGQQPLDFLQPFPQHVVRFPNLLSFFSFSLFWLLLPFFA